LCAVGRAVQNAHDQGIIHPRPEAQQREAGATGGRAGLNCAGANRKLTAFGVPGGGGRASLTRSAARSAPRTHGPSRPRATREGGQPATVIWAGRPLYEVLDRRPPFAGKQTPTKRENRFIQPAAGAAASVAAENTGPANTGRVCRPRWPGSAGRQPMVAGRDRELTGSGGPILSPSPPETTGAVPSRPEHPLALPPWCVPPARFPVLRSSVSSTWLDLRRKAGPMKRRRRARPKIHRHENSAADDEDLPDD